MSEYVCQRAKPTLRSMVVLSFDGASTMTRYAGSVDAPASAGGVASAAKTLGASSGTAARISARTRRNALRVAGSGRAWIIVVHFIAARLDVALKRARDVVEKSPEGRRPIGHFLRRPGRKIRKRASWREFRNIASRRPIEVPVRSGRIAESPQPDADARDARVVVAYRATCGECGANKGEHASQAQHDRPPSDSIPLPERDAETGGERANGRDAEEMTMKHALLRSVESDPHGNRNYRRSGATILPEPHVILIPAAGHMNRDRPP